MTARTCETCKHWKVVHFSDANVMGVNAWWTVDLPAHVAAEISIVQADALEAA